MALIEERQEMSMLEQLPPDIMVHAMNFMDISSRVLLAGCNTAQQRRIFEDCRQAWAAINLKREFPEASVVGSLIISYQDCSRE